MYKILNTFLNKDDDDENLLKTLFLIKFWS